MNTYLITNIRAACFAVWLAAACLNGIFFTGLFVCMGIETPFLLVAFTLVWIVSMLFGLPALIILWLLLPALVFSQLSYRAILCISAGCCALLGLLSFLVCILLLRSWVNGEETFMAIIPAVSGGAAMLFQYRRLHTICGERDFNKYEVEHLGQ